jgi:hypothetical protein
MTQSGMSPDPKSSSTESTGGTPPTKPSSFKPGASGIKPPPPAPSLSSVGTRPKPNIVSPQKSRFSVAPRDKATLASLGGTISRSDREILDVKERSKLYTVATGGLATKFQLVDDAFNADSDNFLNVNHDFFIQVQHLKETLQNYCMDDVFEVISKFHPDGTPDDSDPASLIAFLSNYLAIDNEEVVKKSNHAYLYYGDAIAVENLKWTQDLLLNSCSDELKEQVSNKLFAVDKEHRGGPLVFFYIVQLLVKTNEKSSRAIIKRLEAMKIPKFDGEDIEAAVALIRSSIARLRAADRLPGDIADLVFEILKTCTIFEFRQHFAILKTMGDPKIKDWDTMLTEAAVKFHELEFANAWHPRNKKGSSFVATGSNSHQSNGKGSVKDSKPNKTKFVPDRTPPKPGEPSVRRRGDGKEEHWCADEHCLRWGNHPTGKHQEWYESMKSKWTKVKSKKNASKATSKDNDRKEASSSQTSSSSGEKKKLRFAGVAASTGSGF